MEYYLSNNDGNFYGPFPVHQLLNAGIKRETMVWRKGLTAWYPAYLLPELNDVINNTPPPLEITLNAPDNQSTELPETQLEASVVCTPQGESAKPETKSMTEAKIDREQEPAAVAKTADKPVERPTKKPTKRTARKSAVKPAEKPAKKDKKKNNTGKNKKSKYDYPVSEWRIESIWLLAFVIIHIIMALSGQSTFSYIYLDIFGAILSITGIIIGYKIKALNKVSYAKDSDSRNAAEKLSKFNGFLVSTTAAIGFIIILYQSAHYVYVC